MTATTVTESLPIAAPRAPVQAACDECAGSGGWFRYEPALDPSPGLLYLSCIGCRGNGWLARSDSGVAWHA